MIDKAKGKYFGECDACGKTSEDFDNWEDCKDWIKSNWKIKFNKQTQEWEHYCENCKS